MADVRPFRGLRYNPQVVPDLSEVVSPPFDTISPTLQRELCQRSPHNIVRLEAGERLDSDTTVENRYTRAHALFGQWREEEVLVRDSSPAFYLLRQEFTHRGRRRVRHGLMACVRLEEYQNGIVLPHELTGTADKEDRLALMEACHANFSPIMCLYREGERRVSALLQQVASSTPAMATASDSEDQDYALWRIDQDEMVASIRQALASLPLYIADGHHRYETALRYRDQRRQAGEPGGKEPASEFVLMVLIELDDPGLVVAPYHRVLANLDGATETRILAGLKERCDMAPCPTSSLDALLDQVEREGQTSPVMGMMGGVGDDGPWLLRLRPRRELEEMGPIAQSEAWILEEQLLKPILGESLDQHLIYMHDAEEAARLAQSGPGHIAFFLKPFPLDLFQAIVDSGHRLPRKSTFFYPKLPAGLVINPLEGTL